MSIFHLESLHENQLQAAGEVHPEAPNTRLHFASGHTVVIPTAMLLTDNTSLSPLAAPALGIPAERSAGDMHAVAVQSSEGPSGEAAENARTFATPSFSDQTGQDTVIPLIQEQMEVGKRTVELEKIRLRRETEEITEQVRIPLEQVSYQIEHVPVGKVVDHRPETRQTGDLTIFSLVEERLVTRTELFLREEVHVRRVVEFVEHTQDVRLRKDVLTETHLTPTPSS